MHHVFTFILFFLYSYGFGYTLTRFLANDRFESHAIRIAFGLAGMVVTSFILNLCYIPIDWRIYLVLALSGPAYDVYKKRIKFSFPKNFWRFSVFHRLLIILILINGAIYLKGSFDYPWLEDSDPWFHASASHYIAIEKDYKVPYSWEGEFRYINPYPPGFDFVLGLLNQTSKDLYFILKFYNVLIICISYWMFFFFARVFLKSDSKAILATFFLTCIPCYLSHFIWSHTLVMVFFFTGLYGLMQIMDEEKKWIFPTSIALAAIPLTSATQAVKFAGLFILMYLALIIIYRKGYLDLLKSCLLGIVFALPWWLPIFIHKMTMISSKSTGVFSGGGGTPTKVYPMSFYFFAPYPNWITNPVGVGMVLTILTLIGVIACFWNWTGASKRERFLRITIVVWLIYTFIGTNTKTFGIPIGLFPYRFWMLYAIPCTLLAAHVTMRLASVIKWKQAVVVFLILICSAVAWRSGWIKYQSNTGVWSWGIFWTDIERDTYLWMRRNFPPMTKVFAYVDNFFVTGVNLTADYWSKQYKEDFKDAVDLDINTFYQRLKRNKFEYVVISSREIRELDRNKLQAHLKAMFEHPRFQPIFQAKGSSWIIKVH